MSSSWKLEVGGAQGCACPADAKYLGIYENLVYMWIKQFCKTTDASRQTPDERKEWKRAASDLSVVHSLRELYLRIKRVGAYFANLCDRRYSR